MSIQIFHYNYKLFVCQSRLGGGLGTRSHEFTPNCIQFLQSYILFQTSMIKILLRGDEGAGKTSIAKILFQKEVNRQPLVSSKSPQTSEFKFKIKDISFILYDLNPPLDNQFYERRPELMREANSLIYMMNPGDYDWDFIESANRFMEDYTFMKKFHKCQFPFFVFINKSDFNFLHHDSRESLILKIKKHLDENQVDSQKINFDFTSIKNYSIYQAFSKVLHKTLPFTPVLVLILNRLAQCCRMEKVFVYDIVTKLVIAHNGDGNVPITEKIHDICSELVDMYVNINMYLEQETEDEQKRDKAEISLKESNSLGQEEGKIFRFEQIDCSLSICCLFEAKNYQRLNLLDKNISIVANGLFSLMKAMIQEI